MPGDPGATVVTTLVCFLHFAHEAAGAMGTRHSPRPLLGGSFMHNPGATRRGIAKVYVNYSDVIARSESDEAIQIASALRRMDCFAYARNDGFAFVVPASTRQP